MTTQPAGASSEQAASGLPFPPGGLDSFAPAALLDRSGRSECPGLVSSLREERPARGMFSSFSDHSVEKSIHLLIFLKSQLLLSSVFLCCVYWFLF